MIELSLYNKAVTEDGIEIPVYRFESCYRINIIGGDSGTGKTLFYSNILKALANQDEWRYNCNKQILIVTDISNFKSMLKDKTECLIICDEDMTQSLFKNNMAEYIAKSKNYFLLMDRATTSKIDTNIRALFEMHKIKGKIYESIELYSIEPYIRLEDITTKANFDDFNKIVTEDSESGKLCGTHDCKLYYSKDKKTAMLSNKFEYLRKFI